MTSMLLKFKGDIHLDTGIMGVGLAVAGKGEGGTFPVHVCYCVGEMDTSGKLRTVCTL